MAFSDLNTMILDDNAHMRDLMRAVLMIFGIRNVQEAGDVHSAMKLIENDSMDLAFVDYRLDGTDGLDGLAFCRMIRDEANSPDPFLPIIMVTAYSERSRVLDAINVGVDEFLVKPVRASDVAARINAVVERRRNFVRSDTYFGPDRRRRNDPKYRGEMRRADDPGTFDIL